MVELETERMNYENKPEHAPKSPNVFEQSINLLNAARKQILGY